MSGYAAIGLALGRPAGCPELQPPPRPGGRQANRIARRDEPYDAVVASLLPAPLRKRCHGVIPALRAVLTPGLAPLARRERPTRLPVGRAAWPTRLHAAGSQPACQEDGSPSRVSRRSSLDAHAHRRAVSENGRPPGRRVGCPLRASGPATPLVRLACASAAPSRCWQARMDAGRGPWAAVRARRERSEPRRQHEPPKEARYDVVAPLPSGAGSERSERPRSSGDVQPDCRVGLSSSWSRVRPHLRARSTRPSASPMAAQPLIGR